MLLVILGALLVFAIAAAAVGTTARRLAVEPPKNFFDVEEAVEYVADRLPDEVTARCSYDDVREVIYAHLRYLKRMGLAAEGTPAILEDEGESGPVVVADDEAVAWVLGQVEGTVDLDDVGILLIIDAELDYLRAIGAIGPAVPEPGEP